MMSESDTYLSIGSSSEALYKEKGSKFFAYAYPVSSEEEIKTQLDVLRKEHHSSRHVCYAYLLGKDQDRYRVNDAGEPSGTAGNPILGQIKSKNLSNVMVVVVRYFGGTKLGVAGLIKAYKTSAKEALDRARVIEKKVEDIMEIHFTYENMNPVMSILKEKKCRILSQNFEENCKIVCAIRKKEVPSTNVLLGKLRNLDIRTINDY